MRHVLAQRAGTRGAEREPQASAQEARSGAERPTFISVADRIATIAGDNPAQIALCQGNERMSYGELNALASHLAWELSDLDVEAECPVAICIDRGFNHIVATLAVLRAGGAFVPIDPALPDARIGAILEESGIKIAVVSFEQASRFSGRGLSILSLPRRISVHTPPDLIGRCDAKSEDLAYVLYTSGSTGRPKGVEITHANLDNLISWHIETFGVTSADRASHIAGLGFDASIWEVWPYLCAGASVVIPDETTRRSADLLQQWLIEQQISIAFVPTPVAESLLRADWPPETTLRVLLTGGDALRVWPASLPFELVNNYGPTECTVVATSGTVASTDRSADLPTIGSAVANTSVHILDQNGKPVDEGEVGEIYIGGANVGRGYRNQPELTRERFVPDRFSSDANARLFRTGDLGSMREGGQIAFHGRIDDQVKVRGHRIETDEVAGALNRHPSIAQSLVIGRKHGANSQLVAYVVAKEPPPRPRELNDFLAGSLPHYAIPSMFVAVQALPLTENGKPDRAALPEPCVANLLRDTAFRAPASPSERRLAEIMSSLLGIDGIGADDNFFLMGGHSLLGSQLALRIRATFEVELSLRDVFETRTVSRLAERVERLLVEKLAQMSEEEAKRMVS